MRSPQRGPFGPPLGGLKMVGKLQKIYPLKGSMMPTSNFCNAWPLEPKNQNGHQALGLVTPTFFLWEIMQKFFFLSWGFHILATRKKKFDILEGPNGVPGPFWLVLGPKIAIFEKFAKKNQVFWIFKVCFSSKN